jgi:hypothetical protein
MKQWAPEHLRLATSVVNVRNRLRLVDWSRLDPHSARIIAWCVRTLSAGLKARTYRPPESAHDYAGARGR